MHKVLLQSACIPASMHHSMPCRRTVPYCGSDFSPIQMCLCVLPRPLPRRPALSPYFQSVWILHPDLPVVLGGHTVVQERLNCGIIWGKRRYTRSPVRSVCYICYLQRWTSSDWQETSLIWLLSSSCYSKYGKAGRVQVSPCSGLYYICCSVVWLSVVINISRLLTPKSVILAFASI